MSRIEIHGPYEVRLPHEFTDVPARGTTSTLWPVVHSNNIGVGNATAWAATELSAQSVADGLNVLCAIRGQKG